MHTATLLHDDVVDESDLRRGRSTARMIWGNQASVLVGDFLLGQAFKMMVEVGSLEALDVLSTAASVIAEGEVLQLSVAKNMETTEDDYLSVIRAKTAALFSAACEVGPIIAETSKAERNALRSYGINLGLAFQLIDDVLDYGGSAQRSGQECRR
jgi:octaprenyl-diphosphate synthase